MSPDIGKQLHVHFNSVLVPAIKLLDEGIYSAFYLFIFSFAIISFSQTVLFGDAESFWNNRHVWCCK